MQCFFNTIAKENGYIQNHRMKGGGGWMRFKYETGRGSGIRTHDFLLPKQARYQLRYAPYDWKQYYKLFFGFYKRTNQKNYFILQFVRSGFNRNPDSFGARSSGGLNGDFSYRRDS